ncbi:hypothetical protein G7939_08775 [Ralstonia solanacearum]|uniref:hypothetical protein n=1 Tax=Ralstonia pseudosolanacearum TaxID=1310165 RepID=UPI00125FBE79|nr:hypothetical protein [Ralstonia pseudosolanacearum]QIK23499.1 hypothetical protein G7939_08765 [Ralstonia solanacearum]MCK4120033.1 hypothetical protein [Ralstonia pseudosolanacearum]QIK23501.1 hypothetical protein G7939_08775 [Ralstonia solanacearum]QIK28462.1 hypothetical protein G7947_09045 [Ralstonia solanacearum]QIK28464.1 hypothetical protein G7947_09055 [Ralstonia solanacearum]
MATADSIQNACERLGNNVLSLNALVQIISKTEVAMTEPEASIMWLLSNLIEPLCDTFYELESLLEEKISAAEVVNG